jgi:hypothetical protein
MDLPTAIQLVSGIISIPGSIYVFFQIYWHGRHSRKFFIYNPAGVLAASEVSITYYRTNRLGVVMGTVMMLSFMIPMVITSGIGELVGKETFWHYALSIPIFAIFVPIGVVQCWRSLRRNRQHLRNAIKALEVIRQYVAVLENMGIIVQPEFTQLRSKLADSEIAPPGVAVKDASA